MPNTVNWSDTLSILKNARRVWLTTHVRPDGDAVGSMAALTLALRSAAKTVTPVVLTPIGPRYQFLLDPPQYAPIALWNPAEPADFDAADTIVVLDTASMGQLEGVAERIQSCGKTVLAIDHHATRDLQVTASCFDPSAAATAVLVQELLETSGWPITPPVATALLTGIGSDTGWFRYSNTDARTLRAAGRLHDAGAPWDALYQQLFMADTPGRVRLLGAMLRNFELLAEGRLAVAALTLSDFAACGASTHDREGLLDGVNQIGTVIASVLLSESEDGVVRVSLRSKREVDVAAVAQKFGGGGHERASGCRIQAALPAAVEQIKAAMLEKMPSVNR